MHKLKLIKGISYNGIVSAKRSKPFVEVEDDETAKRLVVSGYFETVEVTDEPKESKRGKKSEAPEEPAVEF